MVPSLRATRRPLRGGLSGAYCPPCQSGSRRIASRCTERSAIATGEAAGLPGDQLIRRWAALGNCAANATTDMPPSDAPTTAASVFDAKRAHRLVAGMRDVLDRDSPGKSRR